VIAFSVNQKPNAASRFYWQMKGEVARTNWQFLGWHPSGCGKIRLRWRWA